MPAFAQVLVAISDALPRASRRGRPAARACCSRRCEQAAAAAPSAEPLTESLLFAGDAAARRAVRPGVGRVRAARRSSRPLRRSSSCCAADETELATKTLDGMAAGGMYDHVGGGFHRYSVDERWLVPHFEKMLYDNALLVPAYLHGWLVTGNERYREVVEQTLDYMVRELRLAEGGFASSQDADTDGVEGLTYSWAPGEGAPEELFEPFEDGRFVLRGELDAGDASAAAGGPLPAPAARTRRQGDRLLERARAGGAGRGGPAPRSGRPASPRRGLLGGVPARTALQRAGPAPAQPPRGPRQRRRLPRRLRQRRERALRAARRDRRAALARGVAPAGAARGRALRRRGARRLLPGAGGGRAPRRAQERSLRPPDPVGQLDARLRAAAAGAHLRRRRARASRCRRAAPVRRRASAAAPTEFARALNALDLYSGHAAGDRDRRPGRERGRAGRAGALRPERGRRLRPGRGRAAARGQGARRRQARGLRLRALRLPPPVTEAAELQPVR